MGKSHCTSLVSIPMFHRTMFILRALPQVTTSNFSRACANIAKHLLQNGPEGGVWPTCPTWIRHHECIYPSHFATCTPRTHAQWPKTTHLAMSNTLEHSLLVLKGHDQGHLDLFIPKLVIIALQDTWLCIVLHHNNYIIKLCSDRMLARHLSMLCLPSQQLHHRAKLWQNVSSRSLVFKQNSKTT